MNSKNYFCIGCYVFKYIIFENTKTRKFVKTQNFLIFVNAYGNCCIK